MIKKVKKSTQDYPILGRWISWVDKPGSNQKIFYILIILCIASFGLEWTYEKHAYFEIENYKGFYAIYGFIVFSTLIFIATLLRKIIKVREDFYLEKSIDSEVYPEDQIQRIDHNA